MQVLFKIRGFPPKPAHRRRRIVRHQRMVLAQQQLLAVAVQRLPFNEYHHMRPKMNYGIY